MKNCLGSWSALLVTCYLLRACTPTPWYMCGSVLNYARYFHHLPERYDCRQRAHTSQSAHPRSTRLQTLLSRVLEGVGHGLIAVDSNLCLRLLAVVGSLGVRLLVLRKAYLHSVCVEVLDVDGHKRRHVAQ
jgi:hypothetical protein